MKKNILIALSLVSFSVFAVPSDFERGYLEGKASCEETDELWHCSVLHSCNSEFDNIGIAPTRSAAILKISSTCLNLNISRGRKIECNKI